MLLMVSVQNMVEALEAVKGGADVIDVKNLQEALVGSAHPWLTQEVRAAVPADRHVSVTLGVVPNQEGTVAMAVWAAGRLNCTSVKVGFVQTEYDAAVSILKASRRALEGTDTKLIGSLFADNFLFEGGLDPLRMVELAKDGGCDGFLIDTLTKDGRNLFDFIPEPKLKEIVFEGKELGMSTALSGHLKITDIDELARINPDIVGVRGAACRRGERGTDVAWEAVAEFKGEMDLRKTGEVRVFDEIDINLGENGNSGWVVIDGRGKSCAGIIAALSQQADRNGNALVEVILSDVLNIYDLVLWTEKGGHNILSQRKEGNSTVRMLIQL